MTAFNVAGLLREAPGASRDYRLNDHYVSLGSEVELAGPLNGAIRLQRTNRGIWVRGRIAAALRRSCARCLEPYVEEVSIGINEEFLPSIDADTGLPLAQEAGADSPRIDEHHEVELDAVLHDELLLTEPMHPLCRPDCAGLCADCGQPLDSGTHEHGSASGDPRFAVLGHLLDRGSE